MFTFFSNLADAFRERVAGLSPRTQVAWKWDLLSAAFAGTYFGCIWTFAFRIARADLHASPAQMGWMAAAPALGYLFATFWARQMDGRAKLPFIFWTWVFSRGSFMFAPLIHTPAQFVGLVCFTTFVFSISSPAYAAIMKEIYPDRQRGRLMSVVRMVVSGMTLLTALVMGRLMDAGLPWQTSFLFGGVMGALSAVTFCRVPLKRIKTADTVDRVSTREFFRDTFGILVRNPGYRWFTLSVFVSGFGNLMATTLYPIHQVDRFQITNTMVANMQNITSIATIATYFWWGPFLDRKGPLLTVLCAISINLIAPITYAFAPSVGFLYIAAASWGIAQAGVEIAYLNTTLMFAEPGKAAQYQALHSTFFGLRGSIAPHCAIPLMQALGARNAFLVSFSILVIGAGLQLISMRDYRRAALG